MDKMVCSLLMHVLSPVLTFLGSMPLKKTQGFYDNAAKPRVVPKYGCVVMEVQDWIDGINNPEWLREAKQILSPTSPAYELEALYSFSVKPKA